MGATLALLAVLLPASAHAGRFYLSTEEIVAPGDQPVVGIESSGVGALSMRVYKLPDPQAFVLSQPDLHRPVTKNTLRRRHLFEVLHGGYKEAVSVLRDDARTSLGASARTHALRVIRPANQGLAAREHEPVAEHARVPLLPDYPLVARWKEDLTEGGEAPPDTPEGGGQNGEFGGGDYGGGGGGNWSYKTVTLGVAEPGVYLVEGVSGEDVGYTLAIVSDLGVVVKQAADQTVAFVVDQATGQPLADAQVTLYSGGKQLAQGSTDRDGLYTAQVKTPAESLVLAKREDSVALVDPTFYSAAPADRTVYLFTDRPVYRPGHEVHFKGVIRDRKGGALQVGAAQSVSVALVDPKGGSVDSLDAEVKGGTFSGTFTLPGKESEPPQGVWRVEATVDGQVYAGEFKIKEFAKPDYKVEIAFDRPSYLAGDSVKGTVSAAFFHGTPLKGADVQLSVYRSRFLVPEGTDAEAGYFVSESEQASATRELVKELKGSLDAQGKFAFEFPTGKDAEDYTYSVEAKVADRSGKAQSASRAVEVTVGRFYLQARAEKLIYAPGDEVNLAVRARDYGEQPVQTSAQVELTAQKREGDKVVPVQVPGGAVQVAAAGGSYRFKADQPGAYLATIKAKDDAGSVITTTVPFFVTRGGDLPLSKDGLQLYSDKPSYKVGEEAVVLVRTPFDSAGVLLTHEGAGLLSKEVVKVAGYSAVHRFKVAAGDSPNVYVAGAAIFGGQSYRRELGLKVPPADKLLKVEVSSDKPTYKPGEQGTFAVAVTDAAGKPVAGADVALSIVDEAIFSISPEIAPTLPEFFFPLVRDVVRGSSSTTFRFYGYGRNVKEYLSSRTLRGRFGFGDLKSLASKARKEFKDTLAFSPNLTTGPDGKATFPVTFPDNLTAWRATARVVTADTRVGSGVTRAKVHLDFRVRLAAPRFFRERDQVSVGVLVDNSSDQAGTAQVLLDADGLELAAKTQTVQVAAHNQAVAIFPAKVPAGGAKITLKASGKLGAFADAEQLEVPRLPFGSPATIAANGELLEGGAPANLALDVPEKASSVRVEVYASTGIGPAIESALTYLVGYPYGCTEQTMDRFLPDLVAVKAYKDLKLGAKSTRDELPKMVAAGVARLRVLQHDDGGWGWWPEDKTDAFMTGYVVQGLALAKKLGFEVPEDVLGRGLQSLNKLASNERDDALRAYLLYDLSLAGVGMDSMLDALGTKVGAGQLSPYAQALVSLALLERGKKEQAAAAAAALEGRFQDRADGATFTDSPTDPWWRAAGLQPAAYGWERDPIESTAAALRALIRIKPDSKFIDGAVRYLLANRLGDHWQSTRDTSQVVFALAEALPRYAQSAAGAQLSASLDGAPAGAHTLTREELYAPEVLVAAKDGLNPGQHQVGVTRGGPGGSVHVQALASFLDQSESPKATRSGPLSVTRRVYKLARSEESGAESLAPAGAALDPDEELYVELELSADQALEYVQVEDPLATGVEVNEADTGRKPGGRELHPQGLHREVRDEKVSFFLRSLPRGTTRLGYLATPRLAGSVALPPARAELMYHPQVRATSDGARVTVGGAP